ncbi:proline-rich receptor-like kinase, putative (DUF1421) [Actinidia rufa]|uniref:Proline-rich receptor-like kinase, putative (DUF1421) n=1 Tax=Actinidia rufa TaxID=165716 RepID=A0A7J0H2X0_9ERIC|nr:proline-rich receptor-like kinase, putative (DUF1421) [Actinidia rufa]
MRSSEFMDKQIMELSGSKSNDSFSFFNPDEDSDDELEDGQGYGFHSHRPLGASHSHSSILGNSSSMDHIDSIPREKVGMEIVSEIDETIKEHFQKLLHSVDSLSTRLCQLESKTHQLENAVDDLKVSAEYDNGRTDGKLRQLENILREVQDGIYFLRDKQEIAQTQLQLAKLQGSEGNRPSEDHKIAAQAASALKASLSASKQSPQPQLISGTLSLELPTLLPNVPSTLVYENITLAGVPFASQVHCQIQHNPIPSSPQPESYYFPPQDNLEITYQKNHVPSQQVWPPTPVPPQTYQPAPNLPSLSQSTQQSQLHLPLGALDPQKQPSWTHHPEEINHMPSHDYQPNILQSSSLPASGPPMHQFYIDSSQQMYAQPPRKSNLDFPSGYSQTPGPANFNNMHPYSESPSHYSSSTWKSSQFSPPSVSSGGSNYTQLPKAQTLPHALPTATSVDTGSNGTIDKVPIDDVVDRVTAMGFQRDLVRATVKKMTENGQSVDLNVVLDKLMNGGRTTSER